MRKGKRAVLYYVGGSGLIERRNVCHSKGRPDNKGGISLAGITKLIINFRKLLDDGGA